MNMFLATYTLLWSIETKLFLKTAKNYIWESNLSHHSKYFSMVSNFRLRRIKKKESIVQINEHCTVNNLTTNYAKVLPTFILLGK